MTAEVEDSCCFIEDGLVPSEPAAGAAKITATMVPYSKNSYAACTSIYLQIILVIT